VVEPACQMSKVISDTHTHTGLVALPRLLRWSEIKRRTFFSRHTVYQSISAVLQLQSASNYVSMSVTKIEEWHRHDEWSIKYESRRGSLCTVYIPVASNHSSCCLSVAYKRKCTHARTLQGNGHLPEDGRFLHSFFLVLLGPFYGAIVVPSVTRCRCCRRCYGHR